MTDPKTLTEALNLGKGYGIETAETIMTISISRTLAKQDHPMAAFVLNTLREEFKSECAKYKAKIKEPVTEEEKKQILEP